MLVDVLGLTLMIPLLPFYAERMGASPAQVGWLIGIYAACQLVSGPFLGRWSDSTGRKPLLIVSQLGTCLGFIVTAFAPNLWVLFLARAIDGLTAGNLSLAQAYISDVTKPEERAKAFGLIGIAFGLGFLIGPAVSGVLSRFDYRLPIFAAAALSAASVLTTWLLLPAVTPGGGGAAPARRLSLFEWRAYAVYFREPRLSSKLWQFLLFSLGFSMFIAGMPLFVERRLTWHGQPFGPEQVGYVWALAGLFGVLWQGPALGRLVNAFGELRLNRAGFIGYVGGYTILAFSTSVPWLVAATAVMSMGSLVRPALTSLITHAAPREEQGVVLGLMQSLNSGALIVGPLIAGYLIEHGLLTTWGLAAAATAVMGLFLASQGEAGVKTRGHVQTRPSGLL
ncbi:MAG TPA: MFS transporter [Vicinamibacterales bacterium]|nr:MFS transporter [Vicinamibacterales bacterium]